MYDGDISYDPIFYIMVDVKLCSQVPAYDQYTAALGLTGRSMVPWASLNTVSSYRLTDLQTALPVWPRWQIDAKISQWGGTAAARC